MDEHEVRHWALAMDKIGRLDFALNALRLALKIDPAIANDDPALVAALNAAVPGLLVLPKDEAKINRAETILTMWLQGQSARKIGTAVARDACYVNAILSKMRAERGVEAVPFRWQLKPETPPAPPPSRQPGPFVPTLQHEQMLALWSQGKRYKEIAMALNLRNAVAVNNTMQLLRRHLGVEKVPFKPGGTSLTQDQFEQIAALWAKGRTEPEIQDALGRHLGTDLVQKARKKLGAAAVPPRLLPAKAKPVGPVTMHDLDRHYMRKIGDEYIFRLEGGGEEIWVRTEAPDGIVFRGKGYGSKVKLRFREVMGATEKRA